MGPALADYNALNGGAAVGAGVASLLIDLKVVLKSAAAIDPVDAGAIMLDAKLKDVTDSDKQFG